MMPGSTKLGLSLWDECRLIQINDKLLLRAAKFKSWIACFSNSEVLAGYWGKNHGQGPGRRIAEARATMAATASAL
jgi:hypothetical protein